MNRILFCAGALLMSVPVWAQTPTPLMVRGCQPGFTTVTEVHVYNVRKGSAPLTEPTPPLPPNWRMIVIPIATTRTPAPAPYNANPVCADPGATYFEVDATTLNGPGVWNTWVAWAVSTDGIGSDASNTVTPPGKRLGAPLLLP